MGTLHPELEIDAGSLKIAELAHRSEVPVDWAIIGLGRSGTSSLAAWLDTHPQLELFRDKTDSFNEGAFHYLFRRTNLEHLVRRDSLAQNPAKTGRRKRRILAGFKEPHLLQQERGRLILAEMQHVKLLVIVKTLIHVGPAWSWQSNCVQASVKSAPATLNVPSVERTCS